MSSKKLGMTAMVSDDARVLLEVPLAMRRGDFSVRMRSDLTGVTGKIADTLNEIIAANEKMAAQLENVGQVVGRDGREHTCPLWSCERRMGGHGRLDQHAYRRPALANHRCDAHHAAVAKGDLLQTVPLDVDGRPLKGEFLRSADIVNTMIKQLSVFTSEVTRASPVRLARTASWAGQAGRGSDGRLERPDGECQFYGLEPDSAGSQHRGGDNRCSQRRPFQKITVDVRGEILQLKGSDQYNGRSTPLVRIGSYPRCAGS